LCQNIESEAHFTNFPNPFNPETTISLDLTAEARNSAEFTIYNIKGEKVIHFDNLIINSILWNGKDENNRNMSAGIYLDCL